MTRPSIVEMINSGRMPEGVSMSDISALSEKHSYCSTFKVLEAIGAKETDELELKNYINRAAVYVQDRSKLYKVISRENLLTKIREESVSHPIEKSEVESNDEIAPVADTRTERSPISEDALEEQIMAAAVMHLGELEVEGFVDEPEEKITEDVPSISTPKPQKADTFTDFLLNLEGRHKKPDRSVIDKFISEDRKITPVKKAFFSPTQMGKMSLVEDESFVTETLAKIYERQGDFEKAARAYKNLSLKYPEKRVYFADLQKKAEGNL